MVKELLSPVGNKECLYAAIHNGADAIYLGGKLFGARKFAGNFTEDELKEAVEYSHLYGVKVYITVNTIIYNHEIEELLKYINYLYEIGVDALIMQDIGIISLVRDKYPDLEINASTQMHNHNNNAIALLKELGIKKVVLDRELSLKEIEKLDTTIEKEVFIHGALCNSYSGCCLFSSLNGGRSGNRGECVQSCRLPYKLIKNNKYIDTPDKYLLSTKELNTTNRFEDLMQSNIKSFKIEGRMKSPSYVGYITKIYRKLIDNFHQQKPLELTEEEKDNLKILFNREFTNGYLFNDKVMNIKSSNHQGLEIGKVLDITTQKIKIKLIKNLYQEDGIRFKNSQLGMIVNKIYNDKGLLISKGLPGDIIYLDNKINLKEKDTLIKTSSLHFEREILSVKEKKIPITISIKDNTIQFKDDKNNKVEANVELLEAIKRPTTKDEIIEKITKLGNTPFIANDIKIDIPENVFINMKSINDARRMLVENLIKERIKINREKNVSQKNMEYQEKKIENYEITILARTKEQIEAALRSNVNRIYVDKELWEQYSYNDKIYLRLPRVSQEYSIDTKNVLVTELGGIHKYKNSNMISDYYLNVVNNYSIKYLLNKGVQRVTLSPEINYNNLDDFIKDKVELIVYGRIELMITKSCPIHEVLNKCPCNKNDKYYLEDINRNRYPIIHSNCLTHIMHYKNINYLDKVSYYKNIGIKSFRLELFDESYEETINLINKIKKEN